MKYLKYVLSTYSDCRAIWMMYVSSFLTMNTSTTTLGLILSIIQDKNLSTDVFVDTSDYFEGVFTQAPWLSWLMIPLYLIGLIFVVGMVLVVWFERSGLAGPYRTLLNQLTSNNISQMILFYCGPTFIDTLRIITGPLPKQVCSISLFVKNMAFINIAMFSLAMTFTKFLCVCVYKSMPNMEDNFLTTYLTILINLLSFLAVGARFYLPGKPILQELICRGHYSDKYEDQTPSFNTTTWLTSFCFLVHFSLSVAIKIKKYKWKKIEEKARTVRREQDINLGDLIASWCIYFNVIISAVLFTMMNKTHPKLLVTYPYNILVFATEIMVQFFGVVSICLLYFPRYPQLRRYVMEFCN